MQQNKSQIKSKSHIDSTIYKIQIKIEDKLVKNSLVHFIYEMHHIMRHAHGKMVMRPSMSCRGYLSEGKATHDKTQDVQPQNMESKTSKHQDRNNKVQEKISKTASLQTKWSLGKEGIVPSDLLQKYLAPSQVMTSKDIAKQGQCTRVRRKESKTIQCQSRKFTCRSELCKVSSKGQQGAQCHEPQCLLCKT